MAEMSYTIKNKKSIKQWFVALLRLNFYFHDTNTTELFSSNELHYKMRQKSKYVLLLEHVSPFE